MPDASYKQVIVVNAELKLPKGKLAAQVAHAAVAAFLEATPKVRTAWLSDGMPKVVLKVANRDELERLHDRARAGGLPVATIEDAGRTVVAEGTLTCIGIGPATDQALQPITGDLSLL
jgi:peptidyl-tRNA hydrolase, PTH2 family